MSVTPENLRTLRRLIVASKDASDLAKKICMLLIHHSENFTQDVRIFVEEGVRLQLTEEEVTGMSHGLQNMVSDNGHTFLGAFLMEIRSNMHFSVGAGDKRGRTIQQKKSYTFWLSRKQHDCGNDVHQVTITQAQLDGISLKRSVIHTQAKVDIVKQTIANSPDMSELAKKFAFLLIKKSRELRKPVRIIVKEGKYRLSAEEVQQIGHGFHDMCSDNCHTHLDDVMRRLGLKFFFSAHRGECDRRGRVLRRKTEVMSYTLWLGDAFCPRHVEPARTSQKQLAKIDLTRYLKS